MGPNGADEPKRRGSAPQPRRAAAAGERPSLIRRSSIALFVAAVLNFLFVVLYYQPDEIGGGAGSSMMAAVPLPPGSGNSNGGATGGSDGSTSVLRAKKESADAPAATPTAEEAKRPPTTTDADASTTAAKAKAKATIAYAVSATSCSGSSDKLLQGAAVLGHSIHLSSIRNPSSGSQYDYHLIAFVHPEAKACARTFESVGYEVQVRDTPINVADIRNPDYRANVGKQSCCGEKEFIKLYSYVLTDYPVAVHLDLDSVVLRPFDDLFDSMLDGPDSSARRRIPVMPGSLPLPDVIHAFFTRDYNMVHLGHKHPGMQGGFLVVRPNKEYFEEYRQLILEGNFVSGKGWNGTYGGYYGAKQVQGLCSYFFDGIHPNTAVELNRCYYNQMADDPRKERKSDNKLMCLDGRDECEDCRATNVSDVVSAHFTQPCGKPWDCSHQSSKPNGRLCHDLRRKWFAIRKDVEESDRIEGLVRSGGNGTFLPDTYFGYCKGPYRLIPLKIT